LSGLFGDDLPLTLDAQIKEVAREIALRRRVYPRWVAAEKLSQTAAERQIEVMEAVKESLHRLQGLEK
jgi:hypothetical protein